MWRNTQNVADLGFRDAGGEGWVRDEAPYTAVQRKAPFAVQSAVRPDGSGVWNRVYVTVTHQLSQGSNIWFAFDLQGQQTDNGGSGSLVEDYMADEDDPETQTMGGAQTFSDLRAYATQVAGTVVNA